MKLIKSRLTDYLQFNHFSKFSEIKHFVSTRIKKSESISDKNLNISFESNMPAAEVYKNRQLLSETVKIPLQSFVMQNQIHDDTISIIDDTHKGKGVLNHQTAIQNSDAMITDKKNICLFLFAADCMPILFFDTKKHIIGVAHSGWKGTVSKIAQKTVIKMNEVFNSDFKDILVGIGPSISVKHYETGKNVVSEVEKAFGIKNNFLKFNTKTNKYHFDLWYSAKYQLTEIGIPETNIEFSEFCTFENNDLFFSARQKNTGRFGAGIMLI
ncbi:MAG: peptidoglycan editing factor PgeF [Bacteroidales bacterium]|nr:peptidoglycan editing factor PgeF [Bacteroidales bacterium]